MIRAWLIAAALGGFLSVAAGAAAALIAVTAMARSRDRLGLPLTIAGWSFAAGMLLFSLSLFALALSGREWLGMITPFGGAGLLVGWAALAFHGSSQR